jgi:hypothetical protein
MSEDVTANVAGYEILREIDRGGMAKYGFK